MYQTEALDELAISFVRNGYFWEEPLVVVPAEQDGKFVVVEGNRRLATLRLLLNPQARRVVAVTGFPELNPNEAEKLKTIPTVRYSSREQVVPYLGFRHITGVKKWDPYSKARYVAQLIEIGRPISQIEDSIGDSERTVKKLYQAYVLLAQIKDELDIDDKEIRANFSLLEVLLGQQQIKTFLGVSKALPTGKIDRVVSEDKLENLSDVVSWVFGNRERGEQRIISDSRQIPKFLSPVVSDPVSYEHLKRTRDLEGAYERSGGDLKYFSRQITLASAAVERALGILPVVRGQTGVSESITRLGKLVDSLRAGVAA